MSKGYILSDVKAGLSPVPGGFLAHEPSLPDRAHPADDHGRATIAHTVQPLMDRLSAPAALLGADGTIFLTNEAWDKVAGRSEGPARGSNYFEVILNDASRGDADSSAILSSLVELLAGNQTHSHVALRDGLAGGKTAGVNLTILPFRDAYYILVHRPDPPAWRRGKPPRSA